VQRYGAREGTSNMVNRRNNTQSLDLSPSGSRCALLQLSLEARPQNRFLNT
jgi:hypothetical protein